jgi:hypothetical protein
MNFDEIFSSTTNRPIKYKGRDIIRIDKLLLFDKNEKFQLVFIEKNSSWDQGIVLKTKGDFFINDNRYSNQIVLWEYSSPKVVDFSVYSKNKEIIVYNVWDVGNGTMHFWHNGGAMEVKNDGRKKIFYCNDGYPDEDFNDLVFSIEFMTSPLKKV